MYITTSELQSNISKYLVIVEKEDIFITDNDRIIARLTNDVEDKLAILDSLIGIIPEEGISLEFAKNQRLSRQ